MKNSGLPTMVEAKSNIPKHINNTLPKSFKSSQNNSLNLISPSKTSLSTQAWFLKRYSDSDRFTRSEILSQNDRY